MSKLEELRQSIDQIDQELVRLFERRMAVTHEVGEYKQANGIPVLDTAREREVLAKKVNLISNPDLQADVVQLYENIMAISRRQQRPFVTVNCACMPRELMESELFGYVKGAFSGAVGTKPGLVEAADGGTLFLDEISELPYSFQGKLLRVLQEREIRRIGDTLTGTAPELIRHYLEVRGIGVVDIQKLFGMSGVKSATQIDLVIQFERWQDEKFYDRLGLDEAHTQIMGVPIPLLTIPVSAGRNLAGIVELAVMNNRQKKYGINSAREFVEQIDSHIDHQAVQEKNR